jgi:hypothetical protein
MFGMPDLTKEIEKLHLLVAETAKLTKEVHKLNTYMPELIEALNKVTKALENK